MTQAQFQARMACLADAVAFIERFAVDQAIGREALLRLTLVVEELFTNTVAHGHRGDSDAPVRIGLRATATGLILHYEDEAPPFDPLQWLGRQGPVPDAGPDGRSPGGLGVHLVAQLAEQLDYQRADGRNRLQLTLPLRVRP